MLKVRGDSMIEAHIADGDFVLIRPQTTARNGDIVVAQVEENAVTLKRFFKEKDKIRLQPANPDYPPQFYDDVRIQGKLIGVIRKPRLRASLGRPMPALTSSARSLTHLQVRSLTVLARRLGLGRLRPSAADSLPGSSLTLVDIHRGCPQSANSGR